MNKLPSRVEDIWCDPECPFFKFDDNDWRKGKGLYALCTFLNKQLYFYDWFIAECQEKLND